MRSYGSWAAAPQVPRGTQWGGSANVCVIHGWIIGQRRRQTPDSSRSGGMAGDVCLAVCQNYSAAGKAYRVTSILSLLAIPVPQRFCSEVLRER